MYAHRISQNLIPVGSPNLKSVVPEMCRENLISNCCILAERQFSQLRNVKELTGKLESLLSKARQYRNIIFSKSNPEKTLKAWAQQFEFVFAQRVRRGQQRICLYSRWWEERALKDLLRRLRMNISRNGKGLVMGAIGMSVFNWEDERIKDHDFEEHLGDLKYISILKDETVCLSCEKGEKSNVNTRICKCGSGGLTNKSYDEWVPFIEKDDLFVWRRPHGEGLYEYKVYGSYYDVTAEDFLNVQVDTDYRKEWDTTAVQLEIGEKDPKPESNSDILYWEMQWPRLFVNRDYVFNRRYKVFHETKTIVIINRTTHYPKFPNYPDKYRVEEYWSCMVIKPYEDMKKPGIEFSLTYFDNPGVNIPASVTTWVAKSAMPDYLTRLRLASRNYREYCLIKGTSKACEVYRQEEKARREEEEKDKLEYCSNDKRLTITEIFEEIQRTANEKLSLKPDIRSPVLVPLELSTFSPSSDREEPPTTQHGPNNQKQNKRTFWKYLHPMYYFT